jgi:hypothetical protein
MDAVDQPVMTAPAPQQGADLFGVRAAENILDLQWEHPGRIRPWVPYPGHWATDDTYTDGTQAIPYTPGETPQQWVQGFSGSYGQKLREIAASLNPNPAFPYLSNLSAGQIRGSINYYFSQQGTQCNGYASIKAWALEASGTLPMKDVKVTQAFANGGWHNVVDTRNPTTHFWDIVNYGNIASVEGDSPSATSESYFGNAGLLAIYHIKDASSNPVIDYLDNSPWRALVGGLFAAPGVSLAINPPQGSQHGLNEQGDSSQPTRSSPLVVSADDGGAYARYDGVTVLARHDPIAGADRYGVSTVHPINDTDVWESKCALMREPNQGLSLFCGGGWWRFLSRDRGYLGVVVGGEYRNGISSETMDGVPLDTLGPTVGINGGNKVNIYGSTTSPVRFDWVWNGRFRVGVPFTLTKPDQAQVLSNANGVSPGGYIDPGFIGLADANVNTGLQLRARVSTHVGVEAQALARVQGFDPTFNGWPARIGGDGRVKVMYESPNFAATATVQGGYGVFARDVVIGGAGSVGARVAPKWLVGTLASGGLFMDGTRYAMAGPNVDFLISSNMKVQVWGGGVGQGATGFNVRPTGGANFTGHF